MAHRIKRTTRRYWLAACAAVVMVAMPGSAPSAIAQGMAGEASKATATPATTAQTGDANARPDGSMAKPAGVAAVDRRYMRQIAEANLAEIAAATIAQSRATSDAVKSFAGQMIDDHGKTLAELQQLAQARKVSLPTVPDAAHQAAAKKMQTLSGAAFDSNYIAQAGIADHRATQRLLTQFIAKARDPELKAFAQKTLPIVEAHLQMAQQMTGQPNAAPPQAHAAM